MKSKIILIGGFNEIVELCYNNNIQIVGVLDNKTINLLGGIKYLGSDDDAPRLAVLFKKIPIVITPDLPITRKKLYEYYMANGYSFCSLVSHRAIISKSASIETGSVVQSGVNVSAEVKIGKFVKINTNANIMHNCIIGDFATIAPNAVILGYASIGPGCYIGANATILPGIKICENVTIGAGAVVTKNIETPHTTFVGIPASVMSR